MSSIIDDVGFINKRMKEIKGDNGGGPKYGTRFKQWFYSHKYQPIEDHHKRHFESTYLIDVDDTGSPAGSVYRGYWDATNGKFVNSEQMIYCKPGAWRPIQ